MMQLKNLSLRSRIFITLFLVAANVGVFSFLAAQLLTRYYPRTPLTTNDTPLTNVLINNLPLNETVTIGELTFRLSKNPRERESGATTTIVWDVRDIAGSPVTLDTFHLAQGHVYLIRDDLGDTTHVHPARLDNNSSEWSATIRPSPIGTWNMISQFAKNGTLYHLTTPSVFTGVPPSPPFTPIFFNETSTKNHRIRLTTEPSELRAHSKAQLRFELKRKAGDAEETRPTMIVDTIFSNLKSSVTWNAHGTGIADAISMRTGFPVLRVATATHPFAYDVTFPTPGPWLIDFEFEGGTANFYVDVKE